MTEIMARISQQNGVELADERGTKVDAVPPMTTREAAFLARGILACAVALHSPRPVPAGTIIGDAHMPIMSWRVGKSNITGDPVMLLTIPSGIELTFVMSTQGAIEMGAALVSQGQGSAPPEGHRGTVH